MLVDATHPEETRVAIVDGSRLNDFDFERTSKKQLKGNIYLAKVIRIEPSLQAAFVEYGGNRHGFLPFAEIHPDYFRIPMADRPADAPPLDDDADLDADDQVSGDDDISAYAEERAMVVAQAQQPEILAEQSVAVPASIAAEAPAAFIAPLPDGLAPLGGFGDDSSHDIGLITDFGNAALPMSPPLSMDMAPEMGGDLPPPPPETVGGEQVEEVQREVRQYRPRYKIQEVVKRRQVMLIQVVKEERGNKGAALTTFLSLAGRYCVLMPNTDSGGGVSRKITSHQDRRRMKEMLDQLEVPEGMAVILRTAGMEQEPTEIQRDLEYLLRLWNNIREETLQSTAPALIYEEANLIKRSLRDLYANDLDAILVAGTKGYQLAHDFMRAIMPDAVDKVKQYEDPVPLFFRYNVEKQIDQLYNPVVQLRSGGYIVINPTEALVSIDVNSGRATRERHIESTALKTNMEAAEEIARQLRLRDLAGLVVIDFIDMEDGRNNSSVERRLKESMRFDRARLQIGRISAFGLLELSRQRIHSSLMEINFEKCPHCTGMGLVRSVDSAAISILRMVEEEGIKNGGGDVSLHLPTKISLYILNQKRAALGDIEKRYGLQVFIHSDDEMAPADFRLERARGGGSRERGPAVNSEQVMAEVERPLAVAPAFAEAPAMVDVGESYTPAPSSDGQNGGGFNRNRRGRNGFGRGRGPNPNRQPYQDRNNSTPPGVDAAPVNGAADAPPAFELRGDAASIGHSANGFTPSAEGADGDAQRRSGRRRGRRGGRGRHGGAGGTGGNMNRPPRDPNYQPRENVPRDSTWVPTHQPVPAAASAPIMPVIPASIHEIDTTPRVYNSAPTVESQMAKNPPQAPSSSAPYQVIQDSSDDKPKGGWWRRLTGQ
jgi:ribonuclease E